jgi:hypothetical protein
VTTSGDADHIALGVSRSHNVASRSGESSGRSPLIPSSLLTHLLEAELESILQLVTSVDGHLSAESLEKIISHCNESLKYSSLLGGTAVTTKQ